MDIKHAVQIVLFNKEGEILCVSRKTNHKDFGLPGGKVDPGETYIEAAIRETKEETGLDIENLFEVFSMYKDNYMGHTYIAEWSGTIQTDEPHVVKWGNFTDIMKGSFGKWNNLVCHSLMDMGVLEKKVPFLRNT